MAEGRSKIKPDTHLVLDQPALKLPYELLHKNFKTAQTAVERDSTAVKDGLKKGANAAVTQSSSPDEILKNLDAMVARMQGLKRKLEACAEEDERLREHSLARIEHLSELYTIPSLDDVKYERWSRVRLNRLLADYLLRNGHCKSAAALAEAKGIEKLVDMTAFLRMNDVKESLREHRFTEALAWCAENKKELRKADVSTSFYAYLRERMDGCSQSPQNKLEFMLRIQQYVEIMRTQDIDKIVREAIPHMKKYITPLKDKYPEEMKHLAGLLAYPPDTPVEVYKVCKRTYYLDAQLLTQMKDLYSPDRWTDLQTLFLQTHNSILSSPSKPPLHIALAAGLSALKTPLCHSKHVSSSTGASSSLLNNGCPICSHELNKLAVHVPYAHHTSSHVDPDAVLLPNMRVYGKQKLLDHAKKAGLEEGKIKDLVTGEIFPVHKMDKVYLS